MTEELRPQRGFQSTLPRGERRGASGVTALGARFQSTLPRGERQGGFAIQLIGDMFQSTLPRGERPVITMYTERSYVFQSTLPRGERPSARPPSALPSRVSIHAPTWGATATISYFSLIYNLHLCNMHNLKQLSNNSTYEFHHLVKHFLVRTSLAIHVCFLLAPS